MAGDGTAQPGLPDSDRFESLTITGFRGIRQGEIKDLKRLNIFVGRNGQGKSTILEAAYVAASAPSVRNLLWSAKRRGWFGPASLEALVPQGPRAGSDRRFSVVAKLLHTNSTYEMTVTGTISTRYPVDLVKRAREEGVQPTIILTLEHDGGPPESKSGSQQVAVAPDGESATPHGSPGTIMASAMIDVAAMLGSAELLSVVNDATQGGWIEPAVAFVQRVVPQVRDVRLVTYEGWNVPYLYYGHGRPSIPLQVAGDGVRRLVHLAMVALGGPPGLIAIEEPEDFLHPGARSVCVELIWTAVERGEQLFVSTHSLEFIDEILDAATGQKRPIDEIAVYRTTLKDGVLELVRHSGSEAKKSRELLGQDLRV